MINMLFGVVNVDVVDQLGYNALGDGGCVGIYKEKPIFVTGDTPPEDVVNFI